MDPAFRPDTAAAIARARRHSVGDLLHRTARRHSVGDLLHRTARRTPDKLAVVAGDLRAKAGTALTAEHVHAHTRGRLAGYKRPKYVVFADALPKNPSGKILKRELREQHAGLATADVMS